MPTERRTNYHADHDTLIRMETMLKIALEEIKKLNAALTDGLSKKLDVADFNTFKDTLDRQERIRVEADAKTKLDHETRLRSNESFILKAGGVLLFAQILSLGLGIYLMIRTL